MERRVLRKEALIAPLRRPCEYSQRYNPYKVGFLKDKITSAATALLL